MEIDINDLKKFGDSETIATGTGTCPEVTDKEIIWVAVSGEGYYDWCIYALPVGSTIEDVKKNGDKIFTESAIRRLVPCNDEAFRMYRK